MSAVLLELAFIDTQEASRLKRPEIQEALATAVTNGVQAYFEGEPGAVV